MKIRDIEIVSLDKNYKHGDLGSCWDGTHNAGIEIELEDGSILRGKLQITDIIPINSKLNK